MTELASIENEVLSFIKTHCRGRKNAKTQKQIVHAINMSATKHIIGSRKLRDIVSNLIMYREIPICTSSYCGYYWPASRAEGQQSYLETKSRIVELNKRADGLEAGLDRAFEAQQSLFEEIAK